MENPRWQRFFAFIIDLLGSYVVQFFGGVMGAFLGSLFTLEAEVTEAVVQSNAIQGFFVGTLFWGTAYWLLNWVVLQAMTGATLGKHVFKLKLVRTDGSELEWSTVLGRTLVFSLSLIFFGLGLIPILVTRKSQGLHDFIFKTEVIHSDQTASLESLSLKVSSSSSSSSKDLNSESRTPDHQQAA